MKNEFIIYSVKLNFFVKLLKNAMFHNETKLKCDVSCFMCKLTVRKKFINMIERKTEIVY